MSLFEGLGVLDEYHSEAASAVQTAVYPILFGRGLNDDNYYLDLSKFTDVELQVAYSPSIAATAFATGTFTSTVLGLMTLDGPPGSYHGTLVTRIIENFTSAASGDKVVKPPRNWPIRFLGTRCYEVAIADGTDITTVKLQLNNGAINPVSMKWLELAALNYALRPVDVHKSSIIYRENDDTVATYQSAIRAAITQQITATSAANDTFENLSIDAIAGDRLTLDLLQADVTAGAETYLAFASDVSFWLNVHSQGIPFTVWFPMFDKDNGDYFDSTLWDEIEVILTQGAAGGDVDVICQEVQAF
jgi:hypothetical protein